MSDDDGKAFQLVKFAHVLALFGRASHDGAASALTHLWANGRLIYTTEAQIDYTDNDVQCAIHTLRVVDGVNVGQQQLIAPGTSDVKLANLKIGEDATIAGFTASNNNGTFKVINRFKRASDDQSTAFFQNPNATAEAAGDSVTVTQDLPDLEPGIATSLTFLPGGDSQAVNSFMEGIEGTGEVPAYRRFVGVLIEKLRLLPFGNAIPQFQALIKIETSKTIASALGDICEQAGLTSNDYDTSGVSGNLKGIAASSQTSPIQRIEPVMLAHDILVQIRSGVIYFFDRGNETAITIDSDDLQARPGGEPPGPKIDFAGEYEGAVPSEVSVSYVNPEDDYQRGTERAARQGATYVNAQNLSVEPLVLTAQQAADAAERRLWQAVNEWRTVEFTLPPKYIHIQESDLLTVTHDGETHEVRVVQVDRGANYLIRVRGVIQHTHSLDATGQVQSPVSPAQERYIPPYLAMVAVDLPPLRNNPSILHFSGFYYGCCVIDPAEEWRGANVYASTISDSDDDLQFLKGVEAEAIIGEATTALGGNDRHMLWDRGNTVKVAIYGSGTLESVTEAEALAGKNLLYIGSSTGPELINFVTATYEGLTDEGWREYTLSTLLRGRYGTGWTSANRNHAIGDQVMLMNAEQGSQIHHISRAPSLRTKTMYWKAIPTGRAKAEAASVQVTNQGRGFRAAPADIYRLELESDADMVVHWRRTTRVPLNPLQTEPNLIDEGTNSSWVAKVYTSGGTFKSNMLPVSGGPDAWDDRSARLTELVWKTVLGFTNGGAIRIDVIQFTDYGGEGRVASWTTTIPSTNGTSTWR